MTSMTLNNVAAENGDDDQHQKERGDHQEDIDDLGGDLIQRAPEITGEGAQHGADQAGNQRGHDADGQAGAASVKDHAQNVMPHMVGAQRVVFAARRHQQIVAEVIGVVGRQHTRQNRHQQHAQKQQKSHPQLAAGLPEGRKTFGHFDQSVFHRFASLLSSVADTRIQPCVDQIDDDHHGGDGQGQNQIHAHQHVIVAHHDRAVHQRADARP